MAHFWSVWSTGLLSFSMNKNGSVFPVSLRSAASRLLQMPL